jgi:hypothetical protein
MSLATVVRNRKRYIYAVGDDPTHRSQIEIVQLKDAAGSLLRTWPSCGIWYQLGSSEQSLGVSKRNKSELIQYSMKCSIKGCSLSVLFFAIAENIDYRTQSPERINIVEKTTSIEPHMLTQAELEAKCKINTIGSGSSPTVCHSPTSIYICRRAYFSHSINGRVS